MILNVFVQSDQITRVWRRHRINHVLQSTFKKALVPQKCHFPEAIFAQPASLLNLVEKGLWEKCTSWRNNSLLSDIISATRVTKQWQSCQWRALASTQRPPIPLSTSSGKGSHYSLLCLMTTSLSKYRKFNRLLLFFFSHCAGADHPGNSGRERKKCSNHSWTTTPQLSKGLVTWA